jgi:AGCS family alanine or glycine:cation symporter
MDVVFYLVSILFFVAIALFFFALILAYYYIAETNISYLTRNLKSLFIRIVENGDDVVVIMYGFNQSSKN